MEANAAGACCVGHVLTICGRMVLPGWAQEDPTDVVDDGAAGHTRFGSTIFSNGAAT